MHLSILIELHSIRNESSVKTLAEHKQRNRLKICPTIAATSISITHFDMGPSYRLSAEVKNWLLSKYDPQKEVELCSWIEEFMALSVLTSRSV